MIQYIKNPSMLEEVAIDKEKRYGDEMYMVSENAVSQIDDEETLARIAIETSSEKAGIKAVNKRFVWFHQDLLPDVALRSKHIGIQIEAASCLSDKSAIGPLKEKLLPQIMENPLTSSQEILLLALCGDKTGRVLLLCTGSSEEKGKLREPLKTEETLEADPDILYPVLKKNLEHWLKSHILATDNQGLNMVSCIKLMHDNGILTEKIEAEIPRVIEYDFQYPWWVDDDYKNYKDDEIGHKKMTIW